MPKTCQQRRKELLTRVESLGVYIEDLHVQRGVYTFCDRHRRSYHGTSKVYFLRCCFSLSVL
jgi:hypothetical protein